jgi:hypothetical protein
LSLTTFSATQPCSASPCLLGSALQDASQQPFLASAESLCVPADPHSFLSDCAVQCSVRTSPLRYWDSPELRHRCRQRSFCADLELRRQLSLAVHRTRRHEKQEWKRNLLFRAACGDWAARRLLTRKGHSSLVVTRPLLGKCSQQAAVELTMWGSILTSGFRILVSH